MSCKYVVGHGHMLDWAVACWREVAPELEIRPIALELDSAYFLNMGKFDELVNQPGATAFAAGDASFLNFRRSEIMGELKVRGFSMPALICPGAIVSSSAVVGQNAVVGAGAVIGPGCQIAYNAVVNAGANLGGQCSVGSSAWVAAGVVVGHRAKVGAYATLGYGVIVEDDIEVGKFSIVDRPGKVSANIAPKTFLHSSFDNPIVIVGQ